MICEYETYWDTQQTTVQLLKEQLSVGGRVVTDANFNPVFLTNYYVQNAPIIENYVLNCYERLLTFWVNDRIRALESEHDLYQGNVEYENWVANHQSPLDMFGQFIGSLFANWEITLAVIAGVGIIYLIKK